MSVFFFCLTRRSPWCHKFLIYKRVWRFYQHKAGVCNNNLCWQKFNWFANDAKNLLQQKEKIMSYDKWQKWLKRPNSASDRPRSSRTHENTAVVLVLIKAIDQLLKECCWSFWLKEDMLNNAVGTKQASMLSVSHISSTGHVNQLLQVPTEIYIGPMFVCLHFPSTSWNRLAN